MMFTAVERNMCNMDFCENMLPKYDCFREYLPMMKTFMSKKTICLFKLKIYHFCSQVCRKD